MPLSASSLAQSLESVFNSKPASSADAALAWANAYQSYATSALSTAASLPVTAPANFSILLGAFQGGLSALASPAAGALVAQGIVAYWQAMVWTGPTAAGTTAFAGNATLAAALAAVFSDLSDKSAAQKANDLANAFDAGARMVIVSDVPFIQPAPPIVGPIM
jgi:hypothetical protein